MFAIEDCVLDFASVNIKFCHKYDKIANCVCLNVSTLSKYYKCFVEAEIMSMGASTVKY